MPIFNFLAHFLQKLFTHDTCVNAFPPMGRVNPFEHEMYSGNGVNPINLREESVCGRKNCGIYYCDRVLKKLAKSWNLLLRFGELSGKLRNLLLRWSTLDKKLSWRIFSILLESHLKIHAKIS